MHSVRIKRALAQATRQGVSHHHRAMTPAGATYAHRDIRLSLAFVKGQKVIEQVAKTLYRLSNLRLGSQKPNYAAVVAGKPPQLRNKMRVGQVSDIKQELEVCRAAVFVTEAQDLHAHGRALFVRTESFKQLTTQGVDRVLGRVDDLVGERANTLH